jgi:glycyl-tRNA synthetase
MDLETFREYCLAKPGTAEGTPFAITVDFETLGEKEPALKDTVTLRERDSMKQERVKITDLRERLLDAIA